jgi:hypothetical protein
MIVVTGSGAVSLTKGSGRSKKIWILRIRIRNPGQRERSENYFASGFFTISLIKAFVSNLLLYKNQKCVNIDDFVSLMC